MDPCRGLKLALDSGQGMKPTDFALRLKPTMNSGGGLENVLYSGLGLEPLLGTGWGQELTLDSGQRLEPALDSGLAPIPFLGQTWEQEPFGLDSRLQAFSTLVKDKSHPSTRFRGLSQSVHCAEMVACLDGILI